VTDVACHDRLGRGGVAREQRIEQLVVLLRGGGEPAVRGELLEPVQAGAVAQP
jgi:hypothetical protein